jgi:hypothetical protein
MTHDTRLQALAEDVEEMWLALVTAWLEQDTLDDAMEEAVYAGT